MDHQLRCMEEATQTVVASIGDTLDHVCSIIMYHHVDFVWGDIVVIHYLLECIANIVCRVWTWKWFDAKDHQRWIEFFIQALRRQAEWTKWDAGIKILKNKCIYKYWKNELV